MTPAAPDLRLDGIVKRFGTGGREKTVLHDVSFSVPAGSVACLLGPNGSGKTTLLKIIATLLSPDQGAVRVAGRDVHAHSRDARRGLGFGSTEDQSFYGRLSVRGNLVFYGRMYGMSAGQLSARLEKLSAQLALAEVIDAPFRELSSGQKQRVLLARALLHDPALLLLDEPHQNLDPHFAATLRTLIREEWSGKEGRTVLVSTHHLDEARKLSRQWVVLSAGRVRFAGEIPDAGPGFDAEEFFRRTTL